jgi:hypothetical protein
VRDNKVKHPLFLAVMTKDPDEAIKSYWDKKGVAPTIILVRPDFIPSKDSPLIARSRHAAWGVMLVSHLMTPGEVTDDTELRQIYREVTADESQPPMPLKAKDMAIPAHHAGRPENPKSSCPHCHGPITDFDSLGYWYGWAFGITPPYWAELREYVFRRDNYRCQKCNKKFPTAFLQAHHMNPKENGGEDGARNLQTLCQDCHAEHKPIFEDEQ